MNRFIGAASLMTLVSGLLLAIPNVRAEQEGLLMAAKATSFYDFTMDDIDGKPVNLGQYKGKALLVVNTASFCGNTPQYTDLESMYEQYHAKGFEILALPANNFGQQEPGTNAEIKTFCSMRFKTTFPLFAKVSVKGKDIAPLYQWLTKDSPFPGDIKWNFTKFLVGRDGTIAKRFEPGAAPESADVTAAIEAALAAK